MRILQKIQNIFLVGLMIALPVSIAMTNIMWLPLLLMTVFLYIKQPQKNMFTNPVHYPLYFFVIVTICAVFFSVDFMESVKELRKTGQILLLFVVWFGIKDMRHAKKLLWVLCGITACTGILSIVSYIIGINKVVNGTFVNVPTMLQNMPLFVIQTLSLNDGRAEGTQSFYLTFAEIVMCVMTVMLPIALSKLISKPISWVQKGTLLGVVLVMFCSIVLTYARGVWLGCIVVWLFLFIVQPRFRAVLIICTATLLCGAALVVSGLTLQHGSLIERMKSIRVSQNIDRISMWQSGVKIVKDYPLFGVGPRCIERVYSTYKMPTAVRDHEGHLHSNYITLAAERGMIGLAAFCALWIAYFFYFYRRYRAAKDPFVQDIALGTAAMIVAFAVSGLTEYSFGDAEVALLLWTLLGFAMAITTQEETIRGETACEAV